MCTKKRIYILYYTHTSINQYARKFQSYILFTKSAVVVQSWSSRDQCGTPLKINVFLSFRDGVLLQPKATCAAGACVLLRPKAACAAGASVFVVAEGRLSRWRCPAHAPSDKPLTRAASAGTALVY